MIYPIHIVAMHLLVGRKDIDDVLYKLPGEYEFPKERLEIGNKIYLVVYIGGITYGELSAIRYLNEKMKNRKIIVLTTGMINYKKIFNSLRKGKFQYMPEDIVNINGNSFDNRKCFKNVLSFEEVNDQINK